MKKTILPIAFLVLAICLGIVAYQSLNRGDGTEDPTAVRAGVPQPARAATQPKQNTLPPTAEATTALRPAEHTDASAQPNEIRPDVPPPTQNMTDAEPATAAAKPHSTKKPSATETTAPVKTHPNMADALIDAQNSLSSLEAGLEGAATASVTSRKNTIVYTLTLTQDPGEDRAAVKAHLEEYLNSIQMQMELTLGEMRNSYEIENMAIQMIYKTETGSTVASRTFQ